MQNQFNMNNNNFIINNKPDERFGDVTILHWTDFAASGPFYFKKCKISPQQQKKLLRK